MSVRAFFTLNPSPPFRLDLTAWALRRRADNIFDRWDGRVYRRVLVAEDGKPFEVAVTQVVESREPLLQVFIFGRRLDDEIQRQSIEALNRLLGLSVNLDKFYGAAKRDETLKSLALPFRGFRPPRLLTPFEALVNAIACQQLTLTMGIRLLNSLTEKYGQALETADGVVHAFPRPRDLANADVEDLRQMKFSYQKARYIIGAAQLIEEGKLDLDSAAALDDESAVKRLSELKGVGRWTAEYVLLRGLGRTHIFPADDVGARNNLERWLELPQKLDYDGVHETIKDWKDYGGLIYFHLLLKSLSEKGMV
ncbi:MAG: hypothetical protein LC099_02285 [Anaerolineales bacterium]|nr:hypothetical protein [Anaerolineales bacterium]